MKESPEECFRLYMAIKRHFSGSYDYFKYGGKGRFGDLSKRQDHYHFTRLAKKQDDLELFLVANFFDLDTDKKLWIGNLINEEAIAKYMNFKKYLESSDYMFEQDIRKIIEEYGIEDLKVSNGETPKFIDAIYSSEIRPETLTIIHIISDDTYLDYLETNMNDKYLFPVLSTKCRKVAPWIAQKINKKILQKIFQKYLTNTK